MRALPLSLRPGAVVGGAYRVVGQIAQGGLGEVWSAVEIRTQRAIAIKRLLPEAAKHPAVLTRFEREAELLSGIYSEFVVRLVANIRDPHFGRVMAMEFVEGEPLSAVLAR